MGGAMYRAKGSEKKTILEGMLQNVCKAREFLKNCQSEEEKENIFDLLEKCFNVCHHSRTYIPGKTYNKKRGFELEHKHWRIAKRTIGAVIERHESEDSWRYYNLRSKIQFIMSDEITELQ